VSITAAAVVNGRCTRHNNAVNKRIRWNCTGQVSYIIMYVVYNIIIIIIALSLSSGWSQRYFVTRFRRYTPHPIARCYYATLLWEIGSPSGHIIIINYSLQYYIQCTDAYLLSTAIVSWCVMSNYQSLKSLDGSSSKLRCFRPWEWSEFHYNALRFIVVTWNNNIPIIVLYWQTVLIRVSEYPRHTYL